MKRIAFCTCLLFFAGVVPAQDKAVSHAESLVERLRDFHAEMADPSAEVRKKALTGFLPSRKDMEILFPKDVGLFWKQLAAHNKRMTEHVDEIAREVTKEKWTEIEAIDVRERDEAGTYKSVLAIIPKDIPVFRAIRRSEKRSSSSSSYLFIEGRWIHLQGLEKIPSIILHSKKGG